MKPAGRLVMALLATMTTVLLLAGCAGPPGVAGTTGPQGPAGIAGTAGVSVTGASVNGAGDLILTLSNGQTIDAGSVIGPQGPAGTSTVSACFVRRASSRRSNRQSSGSVPPVRLAWLRAQAQS